MLVERSYGTCEKCGKVDFLEKINYKHICFECKQEKVKNERKKSKTK